MKKLATILILGSAAIASAQSPDVFFRLDINPHYRSAKDGDTTLRWYDSLGRHSTVGVSLILEPGFRAFVSQRLQRIPNDGDSEQLDEYYLEDPGLWKIGKQYLPFGRNRILNESGRAARGESNLILENLPIVAAVVDNGQGANRGVTARVGSRVGVSLAIGQNFGIQGTSMTLFRRPEEAPGKRRGYKLAFGVDGGKKLGPYDIAFEAVALRRGHTNLDPNKELTDLSVTLAPDRYRSITLGWSRDWLLNDNLLRAQGKFLLVDNAWVEPLVRMKNGEFYDFGVSLRVKL